MKPILRVVHPTFDLKLSTELLLIRGTVLDILEVRFKPRCCNDMLALSLKMHTLAGLVRLGLLLLI